MADAYSQALSMRRGRSLDSHLMGMHAESDHGSHEAHPLNTPGATKHQEMGEEAPPTPASHEIKQVAKEGEAPQLHHNPIHDPSEDAAHARNALSRVAQHGTPSEIGSVRGAVRGQFPSIAGEHTGYADGDDDDDMHAAVTDGADKNEYDRLKGMKPRSLGERAKMDALKSKHEK